MFRFNPYKRKSGVTHSDSALQMSLLDSEIDEILPAPLQARQSDHPGSDGSESESESDPDDDDTGAILKILFAMFTLASIYSAGILWSL